MIQMPMDVLHQFPVRKTKEQKQSFRDAVCTYAKTLGYECTVERKRLNCQNVLFGDPDHAKILVTAHYDTCAKLMFPNFLTPCSLPGFILCVLVQLLFIAAASVLLAFGETVLIAGLAALFGNNLGDAWVLFTGLVTPSLVWLNVTPVLFWMKAGPANRHNANDNTSGVVTLLEIMRTMPEKQREKVCFVLFDQEEVGLIGSSFYRSCHRQASDHQMVLNLDCVGDGDTLLMIPTGKLKKNRKKMTSLYKACGYFGKKSLTVYEKGFSVYPSDQMNFPYGVGICALQKRKQMLYLSRIHTPKDTVLDQTNVNILRAALTTYICCDAAQ